MGCPSGFSSQGRGEHIPLAGTSLSWPGFRPWEVGLRLFSLPLFVGVPSVLCFLSSPFFSLLLPEGAPEEVAYPASA